MVSVFIMIIIRERKKKSPTEVVTNMSAPPLGFHSCFYLPIIFSPQRVFLIS